MNIIDIAICGESYLSQTYKDKITKYFELSNPSAM